MSFIRRIIFIALTLAVVMVLLSGDYSIYSGVRPRRQAMSDMSRGAPWLAGPISMDFETGPTSTGLGWLLDVVNVSVTPYTYSEEFAGESSVWPRTA